MDLVLRSDRDADESLETPALRPETQTTSKSSSRGTAVPAA